MNKFIALFFVLSAINVFAQTPYYDQSRDGFLVFHPIQTDNAGNIIPWYSPEPGKSFDHILNLVWNFWDTIRHDINGLPYYMNHQVWRPENDPRGIGGDQFNMALSSWTLLYMYTGNERVKENMKFIADYYLTHSLAPKDAEWAYIPFPYNTYIYSGIYDGDMVIGKGFTQPDKAGNFGHELANLFKITGNRNYLNAAIEIANTLAKHTKDGDQDNSPLPFKVNAFNGEVGILKNNSGDGSVAGHSSYTTDWAGTLQLFSELRQLKQGDTISYLSAFKKLSTWMKNYPLKNNKWGPFFEDVPGWSDTQINAVTYARYMMENPGMFPNWRSEVRAILDWVYAKLGNDQWEKYGVKVVNEQTVYMTAGNSHTSRQAAAELQYAALSGDLKWKENAIHQLFWATYMVDNDGKNCYPRDEVWLTDGYGDYVRHFLRAMAAEPALAPSETNHILSSTSIICEADYAPDFNKRLSGDIPKDEINKVAILYRTFDNKSIETIRMTYKPLNILIGKNGLVERKDLNSEGWTWEPLAKGGILKIRHDNGNSVKIMFN